MGSDGQPVKVVDARVPPTGSIAPDGTIMDGPDATGTPLLSADGTPLNVQNKGVEVVAKADDKAVDIGELIDQLKAAVGPRENWNNEKSKDLLKQAEAAARVADRLADVCSSSKANRRAAVEAGAFEEISLCMTKFDHCKPTTNSIAIHLRCARALEALCKKAEKEEVQEASAVCISSLTEALKKVLRATPEQLAILAEPGVNALKAITRNNKHNTHKLQRCGGLAGWLAEDSSVVPPDMPETLK
jgi:hypothetical protein